MTKRSGSCPREFDGLVLIHFSHSFFTLADVPIGEDRLRNLRFGLITRPVDRLLLREVAQS